MNEIKIKHNGMILFSGDSLPMVVPYANQRHSTGYDDVEVWLIMTDEYGQKYKAEFVIKHDMILMTADQKEYFDFIVTRQVKRKHLNEANLYDIIKIDTCIPRTLGINYDDRDSLSSLNNEISI